VREGEDGRERQVRKWGIIGEGDREGKMEILNAIMYESEIEGGRDRERKREKEEERMRNRERGEREGGRVL